MRVLLTGAGGQVGQALRAAAPGAATVTALTRTELDVTDAGRVQEVVTAARPQWIINAAAFTAVDAAEGAREAAYALNATAVASLAQAAQAVHARLLQLSTDFVFDGRSSVPYGPGAATGPLSVYGASKLAGEHQALLDGRDSIILRTSWVYAAHGRNFVRTMLRLMASQSEVRVVSDQVGSPTWATGLAQVIWKLLELPAPRGIYHWCDAGVASWYDFSVAIHEEALQRKLLSDPVAIVPIRSAQFPTAAQRPSYSVLDATRTHTILGAPATHWRSQLRKMLDELART
jgi:dTDP-4-dehydrorhamnose reductase